MTSDNSDSATPTNAVAEWLGGVLDAVMPNAIKAVNRLIGAGLEYPTALIRRETAKIDAQTKSYQAVEAAIAKVAASEAAGDEEIVARAVQTLIHKQYRQQRNREAIAKATVELLKGQSESTPEVQPEQALPPIDEDWLNVFERYAEDASTDRMQELWSRVLAGEIRKPGRYSTRTLRFLSEFSQSDGVQFAELAGNALVDFIPTTLVKKEADSDIRPLLDLEAAGLISGANGLGLRKTGTFSPNGVCVFLEGNMMLLLKGDPGAKFEIAVVAVTPLGRELLSLIPGRDVHAAMGRVANAMRSPVVKSAAIFAVTNEPNGQSLFRPIETLWDDAAESPTVPEAPNAVQDSAGAT
jgi:hypothetical protein